MQILFYNRYIFLQITKVMALWTSYLFILFLSSPLLLDLQGNVAILKSL